MPIGSKEASISFSTSCRIWVSAIEGGRGRVQLSLAMSGYLCHLTGPMRPTRWILSLLLLGLLGPGLPLATAQQQKKKASAKAPAKSTPKPAPANPTPPATPAAGAPGAVAPGPTAEQVRARNEAMTRMITAQEKSEEAGKMFRQFIEGTPEERVKLVADAATQGPAVLKYFKESPNREFQPLAIQILGTITSESQPDRLFFPYYIATDKNPMGFVVVMLETKDGFKLDWNTFARGHDQDLEGFLEAKKPGSAMVSLVGISRGHVFSDAPPGGETKWDAYSLEMPPPKIVDDPAKAFIETASATGKTLKDKIGWSKGHLCWLTLGFEGGAQPYLTIKAYQPYAK